MRSDVHTHLISPTHTLHTAPHAISSSTFRTSHFTVQRSTHSSLNDISLARPTSTTHTFSRRESQLTANSPPSLKRGVDWAKMERFTQGCKKLFYRIAPNSNSDFALRTNLKRHLLFAPRELVRTSLCLPSSSPLALNQSLSRALALPTVCLSACACVWCVCVVHVSVCDFHHHVAQFLLVGCSRPPPPPPPPPPHPST